MVSYVSSTTNLFKSKQLSSKPAHCPYSQWSCLESSATSGPLNTTAESNMRICPAAGDSGWAWCPGYPRTNGYWTSTGGYTHKQHIIYIRLCIYIYYRLMIWVCRYTLFLDLDPILLITTQLNISCFQLVGWNPRWTLRLFTNWRMISKAKDWRRKVALDPECVGN